MIQQAAALPACLCVATLIMPGCIAEAGPIEKLTLNKREFNFCKTSSGPVFYSARALSHAEDGESGIRMKKWINKRYGTWRGLIRLLLAHVEFLVGRLRPFSVRHPGSVQRVVFVCRGNLVRSAFAHHEAKKYNMNAASLGLSTSTGRRCPASAIAGAKRFDIDLTLHRTTSLSDFDICSGDLFLAMEVRQARELARLMSSRDDIQVALLGMWCTPAMPHLHDPYMLSDEYMNYCFIRIRQAVRKLRADLLDGQG